MTAASRQPPLAEEQDCGSGPSRVHGCRCRCGPPLEARCTEDPPGFPQRPQGQLTWAALVGAITGCPPSPPARSLLPSPDDPPQGHLFWLTEDTPTLRSQQVHRNLFHLHCPSTRTFILLHLPWGSGMPKPLASDRTLLPHKWSIGLGTPAQQAHPPPHPRGRSTRPTTSHRRTTSKHPAPTCRAVSQGQVAVPTRGRLCLQALQGSLQLIIVVLQVLCAEPDTSSSQQAQEQGMEPAPGEQFRPQQSRS